MEQPTPLPLTESLHGVTVGHTENGEVSIEAPPMTMRPVEAAEVLALVAKHVACAISGRYLH